MICDNRNPVRPTLPAQYERLRSKSRGLLMCIMFASAVASLNVLPVALAGPDESLSIRRIRGILDRDDTWRGHILLTGDTRIEDCTITVEPGTTIEFACPDCDEPPVLSIGYDPDDPVRGLPSRLVMAGTAEKPITVRSHPASTPGQVVWRTFESPESVEEAVDVPPQQWRHVHFERLAGDAKASGGGVPEQAGGASTGPLKSRPGRAVESALILYVFTDQSNGAVSLADCTFDECGRVDVFFFREGDVRFERCRFLRPASPKSVCIDGSLWSIDRAIFGIPRTSGTVHVTGGLVQGLVHAGRCTLRLDGAVIEGPRAGVDLSREARGNSAVRECLIYNRAPPDAARFALSSAAEDVAVERNIVIGGSHCVYDGTRRMADNVFLSAAALDPGAPAADVPLVAALPPGAVFENNLLVGPARALLAAQPPVGSTAARGESIQVRHNTFDGLVRTPRGIHANAPGAPAVRLAVENNLFLRVAEPLLDEAPEQPNAIRLTHNAWAPSRGRPFHRREARAGGAVQKGDAGRAQGRMGEDNGENLAFAKLEDLRLGELPSRCLVMDLDAVRAGTLSVDTLRRRLMAAYRPSTHSPLRTTGHAADGKPCEPIGVALDPDGE